MIWRTRWLVASICCSVILLASFADANRRRCLKLMSSRNMAPGEEFRETKVNLNCHSGDIRWLSAKKTHVLTFTNSDDDLVLCLSITRPGARIYHLKGAQRLLIARENDTGNVGCFRSECKHVSFRFEVGDGYRGPKNLQYAYTGNDDIRCPGCTETCLTNCLCSSEFAFHGKLTRSEFRTNTYVHYFQLAEFVRYDSEYRTPILRHAVGLCPVAANQSSDPIDEVDSGTETLLTGMSVRERIEAEIPPHAGTVRVISKCPLKSRKTYFVSARLHIARSGRPRLVMCCMHADEYFAEAHLAQLLHRQECCRYLS